MRTSLSLTIPELITAAIDGGCEVTLTQLEALYPDEPSTLEKLARIRDLLVKWSLELVPGLERGSSSSVRLLRYGRARPAAFIDFLAEIREGEGDSVEFKQSLIYDFHRARANPGEQWSKYRSDDVLFSSLKTICAFLNTRGGILYVGVADNGQPSCLTSDCIAWGASGFDRDRWELSFRNHVQSSFKDGATVNDYVRVSFFDHSGSWVARVQVLSRSSLSFVSHKQTNTTRQLFRRQGNRTLEIQIDQLEEYLALRGTT